MWYANINECDYSELHITIQLVPRSEQNSSPLQKTISKCCIGTELLHFLDQYAL